MTWTKENLEDLVRMCAEFEQEVADGVAIIRKEIAHANKEDRVRFCEGARLIAASMEHIRITALQIADEVEAMP